MHQSTNMGSILLFLDDERDVTDVTWIVYEVYDLAVVFRTVDDFVEAVIGSISMYDRVTISLDHDLQLFVGDTELTGKTAINMIIDALIDIDTCEWINRLKVVAHTKNPIGKANIEGIWNCFVRTR